MVDRNVVQLSQSLLRICKKMLAIFTKIVEVANLAGLLFVPTEWCRPNMVFNNEISAYENVESR